MSTILKSFRVICKKDKLVNSTSKLHNRCIFGPIEDDMSCSSFLLAMQQLEVILLQRIY